MYREEVDPMYVTVATLIVVTVLWVPVAAEQNELREPHGVWQFKSGEEYPAVFGPAAWIHTPEAQLTISCPADPDRFEISVLWIVGSALSGTVRTGEMTDISIKFDDEPASVEQWMSVVRAYQIKMADEAVDLLKKLLAADELTVSADFVDETTHTATFNLASLDAIVARMTPRCSRLAALN
jgi:hypothetical protein